MPPYIEILVRGSSILLGLALVAYIIMTTLRVFVLPRGENAWLARLIFRVLYQFFLLLAYQKKTYTERDGVLAMFAPVMVALGVFNDNDASTFQL